MEFIKNPLSYAWDQPKFLCMGECLDSTFWKNQVSFYLEIGNGVLAKKKSVRPILDTFGAWVLEASALKATNKKSTAALMYSTNPRRGLKTF